MSRKLYYTIVLHSGKETGRYASILGPDDVAKKVANRIFNGNLAQQHITIRELGGSKRLYFYRAFPVVSSSCSSSPSSHGAKTATWEVTRIQENEATKLLQIVRAFINDNVVPGVEWKSIHLSRNVCKAIDSSNKLNDAEDESLSLIKKRYPNIFRMTKTELSQFVRAPPHANCKQFVIGTFEHQSYYFMYNQRCNSRPFILSSAKDWTEDLNRIIISCGMQFSLNHQSKCPVRVLIPKDLNKLLTNKHEPRITLLELCIVLEDIHSYKVKILKDSKTVHLDHYIVLIYPQPKQRPCEVVKS